MPDYKTFSDSELIALLRIGHHSAFTEAYNRYYYLMFVFAYKKLRDEDQAKDFVQDLFTNLWAKKEALLETGVLAAYLYVSLRNKILDYFVHQKVKAKYINSLDEFLSKSHTADTDYLVREKELKVYIDKQIQKLPDKMRKIFELSRVDNLTYKEIGRALSISEKTVDSQMVNALGRLRAKLGMLIPFFLLLSLY